VPPALTKVATLEWTSQRIYTVGTQLQVTCTAGSVFVNMSSVSLTKTIECKGDGTWEEKTLVGHPCVKTCNVPYSDHNPSIAVGVGRVVNARCKTGYRTQATGAGQTFVQCTNSRDLNARCAQSAPGSAARLDFECMKVTCGSFTAYPLDAVTVNPTANSRYSDANDENGNAAERTRVDCGKNCRVELSCF